MDEKDTCETCGHDWMRFHDGMGDCHHLDGRTQTGLCNCGDRSK